MLSAIKLIHTVIWALFAGAILALPVAAFLDRFDWAAGLTALVLVECAIIAANRGRCPLTDVAARHTKDRRDNFDIFLPEWLARHNKTIFGALFVAGMLYALWRWLTTA